MAWDRGTESSESAPATVDSSPLQASAGLKQDHKQLQREPTCIFHENSTEVERVKKGWGGCWVVKTTVHGCHGLAVPGEPGAQTRTGWGAHVRACLHSIRGQFLHAECALKKGGGAETNEKLLPFSPLAAGWCISVTMLYLIILEGERGMTAA